MKSEESEHWVTVKMEELEMVAIEDSTPIGQSPIQLAINQLGSLRKFAQDLDLRRSKDKKKARARKRAKAKEANTGAGKADEDSDSSHYEGPEEEEEDELEPGTEHLIDSHNAPDLTVMLAARRAAREKKEREKVAEAGNKDEKE